VLLSLSTRSQSSKSKYTDYERGYRLMYYGQLDSAFLMFNRYINNPDDTLKKGKAYRYMGEMQWNIGDLYGAQESLAGAIRTLDPLNEKHREDIGYTYSILGNVSLDLKLYDEAINFYNNAIPAFTGSGYLLEIMNSKATAFQKKGSYNDAIAVYDSTFALKPADKQLVARIIDNRAKTKWLQNPGYPALPEFWEALKIRTDSNNNLGLNASYAHLSDYYAKENPDSALWYAQKMREKAIENQSPSDILEAIDKLIRLNSASSLKTYWYEEYKRLDDSLQLSRDTTVNRFALIRYDAQKSKADNLALQEHITKQRVLIYGVALLAIGIIILLWAWYAKRRRKIKQDAENEIRDAKLKTSQKVHDVVANGLYRIMNELEHGKAIDREPLMTRIEGMYERSRNISYEEISTDDSPHYDNQIHDLLNDFTNDRTEVFVVGNQQTFWDQVTMHQRNELLLILSEMMVNMKKHSDAKSVVIRFARKDNKAFLYYSDNGTGFSSHVEFGNGLKNTVNRIKSLNGEVIFGKSEKGGASITICFPLEPVKHDR